MYSTWLMRTRCMGHSARVTALDWSVDGLVLRSNSAGRELLFWDAKRGST